MSTPNNSFNEDLENLLAELCCSKCGEPYCQAHHECHECAETECGDEPV
jgi:hypothetical protein